MKQLLLKLDVLVGRVADIALMLASAVCLLMALHIVAEFTSRFVFNRPLPGTVAIVSNYYMIAATFLPLAAVERLNGHISVELVTQTLSPKLQRFLMAVVWVMAASVAFVLMSATWSEAEAKRSISAYVMESGYRLQLWPAHYLLPAGFGLLAITYSMRFLGYVTGQTLGGDDVVNSAGVINPDHGPV